MFAIITLLAALICTENADGTWTCSSDGPSVGPDSGIVVDPSGSYVCTNCTAISSNECERIKNLVMSNCIEVIEDTLDVQGNSYQLQQTINGLIDTFSSFVPCPYQFLEQMANNNQAIINALLNAGYSTSTYQCYLTALQRLDDWKATANYQTVQLEPPLYYTTTSAGENRLGNFNCITFHNSLVGLWQASYSMAQSSIDSLHAMSNKVSRIYNAGSSAQRTADLLYEQTRDTVTCAPCTLGSSSGAGGGSGSQTGCLDCYLNHLSRMDSNLDSINDALQALKPQMETYMSRVRSVIERNFDIPLSSLSNLVSRIDDYLQIDQQQYLTTINAAVESLTNQVHYFDDYILADFYRDHLDQQFDMNQAIAEIPDGGGETWENLTWFSRIEALLGAAVGLGTSSPSNDVDSSILNDYDQVLEEVEADSSGTEARQSITTVFESLGDVLDAFNIFENVSEPSEIFLLQDSPLPLHSSSDTATITIQVPDAPALITFLRFVRYAFIAFYWFVALVGFVFAVVKLYSTVVSILRWSSSFLGNVFGG